MDRTCKVSGCNDSVRPKKGTGGRRPEYCVHHANDRHPHRPFCLRCFGRMSRDTRRKLCRACIADRGIARNECRSIVRQMIQQARLDARLNRVIASRQEIDRTCNDCGKAFRSTVGHRRCDRCRNHSQWHKTRAVSCIDCHALRPCRTGNGRWKQPLRCDRCTNRHSVELAAKKIVDEILRSAPADCKTCITCGDEYTPVQPKQRRCTECANGRKRPWRERSCVICGRTFNVPNKIGRCRITCSDSCATIRRIQVDRASRKSESYRLGRERRRMRKRNAYVADVRRSAIYERDKWTCQLCGKKVLKTKTVPHPRAPVLDHVIPLAKGGTHEPANVQLACFLCNSVKSDRAVGEQLRLIG